MGKMKEFLIQVSEDMGYLDGEINDEVLEEAKDRLAHLLDETYEKLREPDLLIDSN